MKLIFRLFLGMFIVCVFQYNALATDPNNIRVVDMQKFQKRSKRVQQATAVLTEKLDKTQKILDKEKRAILQMEEEIKKQSMVLNLDAQEDKKRDLEKKKRHYNYLYKEFEQEVKHAELEATKTVTKEVGQVVQRMAKEEGYMLIFDRRTIGLIYYDDSIDITDKVIKAYDESMLEK